MRSSDFSAELLPFTELTGAAEMLPGNQALLLFFKGQRENMQRQHSLE